jgi:hypothetical protein
LQWKSGKSRNKDSVTFHRLQCLKLSLASASVQKLLGRAQLQVCGLLSDAMLKLGAFSISIPNFEK